MNSTKLKKPAAIPPQGCAYARQPHIATTIAFFMVDPPSAKSPCLLRERGGFSKIIALPPPRDNTIQRRSFQRTTEAPPCRRSRPFLVTRSVLRQ